MSLFDFDNIKHILRDSNIGVWKVAMPEGQHPYFLADEVMDNLLGITTDLDPEEKFDFHRSHIHPDDLEIFDEYSHKLAEKRTEVVYRYIHPTKGELYVRCSGVKDSEAEEAMTFTGIHQDISEYYRYEHQKIAEMRLAEAVAEKEAALEKAKRASIAKTEFLSRMSHDIRTPLNGLIGIMEINEAHSDDVELLSANRKKARVAANHLLSLINDVLDISKLEDDSIELIREPVNITDICMDALTISNIKAKENGIVLKHDDGLWLEYPNVFSSSVHLKQIFLNILNNSIKYNRPGGEIDTEAELISKDGNIVRYGFRIKDTGIGMTPEFLEHIFEPFTQAQNDARSRYQGTGLGMSIVKKIIDKMHGTIEVSSKEGLGTEFYLEIPFEINYHADLQVDNQDGKNLSIEGMHILLVEDNELNMEIAKYILEDKGAIVTTAINGEEAFEAFAKNLPGTFDAILMDVMMPVLDGYGATAKIRMYDRPDAQTIPIIAMTANAFAEDVQMARDAGMNGHISKPIQLDILIQNLAKYK